MRRLVLILSLAGVIGQTAQAFCTTSGQPGTVLLASHMFQVQDDAAYKAGRDVWVDAGYKADAQVLAWLIWSSFPTGQGCVLEFVGITRDGCAGRVDVQFEQRTAYNVGIAVTDTAAASRYPYTCSLDLLFHIYDANGIPNPRYDPADPMSGPPFLPDPGFNFSSSVRLDVTGEHYINPGGVSLVPPGVLRNGCPQRTAADADLPDYMFTGPGCAGPSGGRTNSVAPNTTTSGGGPVAQRAAVASAQGNAPRVGQGQTQTAASIRAASRAKLSNTLAQMAANTRTQNGRPTVRRQQ